MKHAIRYNSPVILTFAFLCLAALFADFLTAGVSTRSLFMVYHCSLSDPLAWFRFIGHIFGHGSFGHFMNNMMIILLVGPSVEDRIGSRNLMLCILTAALLTGVVHFCFFSSALLGASGIAFMLIVMNSFSGYDRDGIPLTVILILVLYVGNEILKGMTVNDNISQLGHVLGGATGLFWGFILRRKHA